MNSRRFQNSFLPAVVRTEGKRVAEVWGMRVYLCYLNVCLSTQRPIRET